MKVHGKDMSFSTTESPILLISYFYGSNGCCPAEWADDKVFTLSQMGKKTILLTSILSKKASEKNTIHYRIPSLSLIDVRHELDDLKRDNRKKPIIKLIIFLPFILLIGFSLDMLQKVITSGNGGGKWSWALPASICAFYLAIRYKCKIVFTTGGPASAHLAGVFTKLFLRRYLICELQDPLTGEDIGRNSRSSLLLNWAEKIIIQFASKIVFVTKHTADYIKIKYPKKIDNIVAIYPGSRIFEYSVNKNTEVKDKLLTIIHLGTLYSTRNFYTLIEAIDLLIVEGKIKEDQIQILNLGEIYGDIKKHHLSRLYIKQVSIKPRPEAVKIAAENMVSLLIQHADGRSNATIPYKTYDYMNIGNPILGLTNSPELFNLLTKTGHIPVSVFDVDEIKSSLLRLLNEYKQCKKEVKSLAIDIFEQTEKIFE